MATARLASKFRTVRNLKIAATTLYGLADYDEAEMPAIIAELSKHATKKKLKPRDAERIIQIGIGRHRHGDHPDATLVQLVELSTEYSDESWYGKAVAVLKASEPVTDDQANMIVAEIQQEQIAADRKAEKAEREVEEAKRKTEEAEADSILDGPSPALPAPTTTPPDDEPQKFEADGTEWADEPAFRHAVPNLLDLRTKSVARFVGIFSPADLRKAADFLADVEAAEVKAAAKPKEAVA
jgi:hypothetical protein